MIWKSIVLGVVLVVCASAGSAQDLPQGPSTLPILRITDGDVEFVKRKVVLAAKLLNEYWEVQFRQAGYRYSPPGLMHYTNRAHTACNEPKEEMGQAFAATVRQTRISITKTSVWLVL